MELLKYRLVKVLVRMIVLLTSLTACQSGVDFTPTPETLMEITDTPTKFIEPTTITPATDIPIPTKQLITTTRTVTPSEVALESTPDANLYFSLANANTAPPQDIIKEIGYFPGAGPRDCDVPLWERNEAFEITACPDKKIEQMGFLRLMVTGLYDGTPVTLTIIYPDESKEQKYLRANFKGEIIYDYIPELTDQVGEYIFHFQTPKGILQENITIIQPTNPRMYILPDQRKLILVNFTPHENIRLFLYGSIEFEANGYEAMENNLIGVKRLKAWRSFQADGEGSITIEYPPMEWPRFVAVGDVSGQVTYQLKGANSYYEYWAGGDVVCPEAPPPLGLQFGDDVVVVTPNVLLKLIKYSNGFSPDIQYALIPEGEGTIVKIEFDWGSPWCDEKSLWWRIECPQVQGVDCEGNPYVWIPEGYGDTYYILPLNP